MHYMNWDFDLIILQSVDTTEQFAKIKGVDIRGRGTCRAKWYVVRAKSMAKAYIDRVPYFH